MKTLIFDAISRRCIGAIEGDKSSFNGDGVLIEVSSLPEGVNTNDLSSLFLAEDGVSVTQDVATLLCYAKAARKNRIKQEASTAISALDWRLERARERAEGGITGVETVANVLAAREEIRKASNKADAEIDALVDVAAVQAFVWSVRA